MFVFVSLHRWSLWPNMLFYLLTKTQVLERISNIFAYMCELMRQRVKASVLSPCLRPSNIGVECIEERTDRVKADVSDTCFGLCPREPEPIQI